MNEYKVIQVEGRGHVVRDVIRWRGDQADYQHTGMALCGVLLKGETLRQWIARREDHQLAMYDVFTDTKSFNKWLNE